MPGIRPLLRALNWVGNWTRGCCTFCFPLPRRLLSLRFPTLEHEPTILFGWIFSNTWLKKNKLKKNQIVDCLFYLRYAHLALSRKQSVIGRSDADLSDFVAKRKVKKLSPKDRLMCNATLIETYLEWKYKAFHSRLNTQKKNSELKYRRLPISLAETT